MHLTLSPARTTTRKAAAAPTAAVHARSASEPCHPALARLHGTVRALRAWSRSSCGASSSSGSGHGLALLETVLAALGDLLATPRAAAALHDPADDDDKVLDGLLVLADAYGTFESALLAEKQTLADAQAGARRGDGAVVTASVRAHKRTEKELHHLAAAMRHASRRAAPVPSSADATDTDVVGAVAEAAVAAAEASAVVFSGCAAMSPDVSAMVRTVPSHRWLPRLGVAPGARKVAPEMAPAALQRLEELEDRIAELESESEKVFRRLLQARVLLLNIHDPL
ncbi:uncharacterized protein [Miscanthus floridulus]|uniref:uncharacterized protein n=1 Tax=Miscanthus floridulus TaxID=154761 RepID=UPI003458FF29